MTKLDRADNLLKKQLVSLNRHLPPRRKTLAELLEEEQPHVMGADSSRHRFKNSELKKIAAMIDEEEYKNLKLPIYIEIQSSTSGARITGKLETKIVSETLKIHPCKSELFIYRADVKELRKVFPTATQYIFLVR